MAGVIGGASEFYRLRVIRVDEGDVPDLEWREDILYRTPRAETVEEYDVWQVQAVDTDDEDRVIVLQSFQSAEDAHAWAEDADTDLHTMTRSEFERTHFPREEDGSAEV